MNDHFGKFLFIFKWEGADIRPQIRPRKISDQSLSFQILSIKYCRTLAYSRVASTLHYFQRNSYMVIFLLCFDALRHSQQFFSHVGTLVEY